METGLISLFFGSILASTVVPGGVEVLLYFMAESGNYGFTTLLVVASVGNTLGGIITFSMGILLHKGLENLNWYRRIERFFHLSEHSVERVRKWGLPALLFTWLPVVGDPICLAGGYLRLPFWPSVILIGIGKFLRYLVLLWLIYKGL